MRRLMVLDSRSEVMTDWLSHASCAQCEQEKSVQMSKTRLPLP